MVNTNKEEHRLFDGQWINIVNHDSCYQGYSMEDAVNLAVKKTEEAMAKNIRDDKWPKPHPWSANEQAVTNESLRALVEHGMKFGNRIEIRRPDGTPEYRITVERIGA